MQEPDDGAPSRVFEQYMRFLVAGVADEEPESLPLRVVIVAAKVLGHRVHAALTLVRPGRAPVPLAASDELSMRVNALQCELGQGPSLHADLGVVPMIVDDLSVDSRWPAFGPACVNETGMRSMLAIRLPLGGGERVALSFSSGRGDAFGADDASVAVAMMPHAALAVGASLRAEDQKILLADLRGTPQISTAVGIVMSRYSLGEVAADALLRRVSVQHGVTLRELAEAVARTGRLPA